MSGNDQAEDRIAEKLQGLIVQASGLFSSRRDLLMRPRTMRDGAFKQRSIAKVVVEYRFQVIQIRSPFFVVFQNGNDCNKRRMLGRNRSTKHPAFAAKPWSRYSCYRCAWAFWRILGFVGAFAGDEAAVVLAGEAPLPGGAAPLALVPGADAGVAAGVGNDVSGVGSGGSGLDRTLAIISLRPLSDLS